jgi:hypothetical protein
MGKYLKTSIPLCIQLYVRTGIANFSRGGGHYSLLMEIFDSTPACPMPHRGPAPTHPPTSLLGTTRRPRPSYPPTHPNIGYQTPLAA